MPQGLALPLIPPAAGAPNGPANIHAFTKGHERPTMAILIDRETRLMIQGITGREGQFHGQQMLDYGTKVVAGVTPGKAGQTTLGSVPVFNTVASAAKEKNAAWLFMQWATSKKILTDSAVKNNINPTRVSAANDPMVLEYMAGWGDYAEVYQELINEYSRVLVPALPEFAQVGDVWAQSVQEVVLGQKDAKTAMDEAAAAMDQDLATIKPA